MSVSQGEHNVTLTLKDPISTDMPQHYWQERNMRGRVRMMKEITTNNFFKWCSCTSGSVSVTLNGCVKTTLEEHSEFTLVVMIHVLYTHGTNWRECQSAKIFLTVMADIFWYSSTTCSSSRRPNSSPLFENRAPGAGDAAGLCVFGDQ